MKLFRRAKRTGNKVEIPVSRDLGLVDLLKRRH
jgi:hypothetical protein